MVARQPMFFFDSILLPNIPEIRGEPLKLKLYGLRGDVERLGATDACVACANLILGNRASVTHSAMRTRRMQELLEKDEVGGVRLEMVAEQPPAGVRLSDESEERDQKRLRSIAAGKAAVPSTEVRSESIPSDVESRKRAADTAIEDIDPRT